MRLGVETGGTKILARMVADDGAVLADGRWPTTTPQAAAEAIIAFVHRSAPARQTLSAIGMAAFGPLRVDPTGPDHGRMLATAKPGWTDSNLRLDLATRLGVAVQVDTDVNAAALAELAIGAGRGLSSLAYLTVGTGIGAGLATTRGTLTGALHPEVGHIRVVRREDDTFICACPFHTDCAEGLAAGPAIAARLAGASLDERPQVAAIVADYIAQLAIVLVLTWAPHRIVIGGGVGSAPGMLKQIRAAFTRALGAYGLAPCVREPDFIAPTSLADAGLEGALLMAKALETA